MDALLFFPDTAQLCINFLADLTQLVQISCVVDEVHSTRFAGSILFGAMLSEMAPFVAAAEEFVLFVVTHFGGNYRRQSLSARSFTWWGLKQHGLEVGTYWMAVDGVLSGD